MSDSSTKHPVSKAIGAFTTLYVLLCGSGFSADTKTYAPGPPMTIRAFVWPQQNATYGDSSFVDKRDLQVLVEDYDDVTYTSSDGSKTFTNKAIHRLGVMHGQL